MTNLYMIDTNSMGIPMIYQIQRGRRFPLPTYDLSILNRVKVTVFGKIRKKPVRQMVSDLTPFSFLSPFLNSIHTGKRASPVISDCRGCPESAIRTFNIKLSEFTCQISKRFLICAGIGVRLYV